MKIHFAVPTSILLLVASSVLADAPPFEDEDILALEFSGELLAPPALVSQMGQDLAAIRFSFPEITDIHVFPDWIPGELIVKLTEDGWAEYLAGSFAEFDSLNAEYGPVSINPSHLLRVLVLNFEVLYHPEVLEVIYEGIDGVSYAEPNHVMGDGDDITCEQLTIYTFKRGWGDCPSGCMYEDFWVFSVIGGYVDLIAHYGDSVSAVEPGLVGREISLQRVAPNPFNPSTTIKYRLNQADWVRLEIFDLMGRPIVELVNGFVELGEHEVAWHGQDGSGAPVASGVYFCRLVVDGVSQVQEMTLLK